MLDLLTFICVALLVLDSKDARVRAHDFGTKLGKLWKRL